MNPTLTISVATYKRWDLLEKLLHSIEKSNSFDWNQIEVDIVIDGHDDYESIEMIHRLDLKCLRLFVIEKVGLAGARNYGAQVARGEFIRLQDDDDSFENQTISRMLYQHKKYPKKVFLGHTKIRDSDNLFMEWATNIDGFLFKYPEKRKKNSLNFEYFWGGRTSLPTRYLKEVPFNEQLTFGAEDIEWAHRFSLNYELDIAFDPKIIGVMERNLNLRDAASRAISQGWSNAFIKSINQDTKLGDWAELNSGPFITQNLQSLLADLNILKRNSSIWESNHKFLLDLLRFNERNVLTFLHAGWWRVINISKGIGYRAFEESLARNDAISAAFPTAK
jgi:glycosyltransferase involved in cell wall biosynthesis